MVEPKEPNRRSRTTLIAVTVGVVIAAALVAYGFSTSDDDDRVPTSTTPPTIGAILSPGEVATTQNGSRPAGSAPDTADVPTVPTGTADVVFPPVSVDIPAP
ncbi:MAG: hypothetical protein ABI862_13285 [Ilumatobacteraceae bacterium]